MRAKSYLFGVRLNRTGTPVLFVHKSQDLPPGCLCSGTLKGLGRARAAARRALASRDWSDATPLVPPLPPLPPQPKKPPVKKLPPLPEPPRLKIGSVAIHHDADGEHVAIVLRESRPGWWLTLFFTSNPKWGRRRASAEEVALAGFVLTRDTYLSPMLERQDIDLIPVGPGFPRHLVEALEAEFSVTKP